MGVFHKEVYRGHTIYIRQEEWSENPMVAWDWEGSTHFVVENVVLLDGDNCPEVEEEYYGFDTSIYVDDCVLWDEHTTINLQTCVSCPLKKDCEALDYFRQSNLDYWANIKELHDFKRDYAVLSVYKYEHGNVAYNTSGFSCPWDSGCVGYISVKKSKFQSEEHAIAYLEGVVNTFHLWASGQVYYFSIEGDYCDDSCGGYFTEYQDENWTCMLLDAKSSIDRVWDEIFKTNAECVKAFNQRI